jgi:hypothetical protein
LAITASRLRVALQLPRAEEALLYWLEARSADGRTLRRRGLLELTGSDAREIALPQSEIVELRLRLLPAYLPYLNLRTLEVRG